MRQSQLSDISQSKENHTYQWKTKADSPHKRHMKDNMHGVHSFKLALFAQKDAKRFATQRSSPERENADLKVFGFDKTNNSRLKWN